MIFPFFSNMIYSVLNENVLPVKKWSFSLRISWFFAQGLLDLQDFFDND